MSTSTDDDLAALRFKAEARKNIPRQYDAERDMYYIDTAQLQDLTTPQSLIDIANAKKDEPIFYDDKKDLFYTKDDTKNDIELGKGEPPKIPPIFGERVKVYDENMEIKIDKDGRSYIGMSIEEIQQNTPQNFSDLKYDEVADLYFFTIQK
jgi:hypothetical protein